MKIKEYRFSFEANSFTGEELVVFLNNYQDYLSFRPYYYEASSLNVYSKSELTEQVYKNLSGLDGKLNVRFFSEDGESQFTVNNTANRVTCQSFSWKLPEKKSLSEEIVQKLIKHPGFITGYLFDADFVRWQSEVDPTVYKFFNRPLENVKLVWNDFFGEEQIDISQNYGRLTLVKGMWLMASPIMWFGANFFQHRSKERLLEFSQAMEVKELDGNIVRIKLFKELFNSAESENFVLLKKFRAWIKMDDLEKILK